MDDRVDPQTIRGLLNHSLTRIDPSLGARLIAARMRALERHETQRNPASMLVSIGHHASHRPSAKCHKLCYWVGAICLVASLLSGIAYWQQTAGNDSCDDDIGILTDDLPLQYYLD